MQFNYNDGLLKWPIHSFIDGVAYVCVCVCELVFGCECVCNMQTVRYYRDEEGCRMTIFLPKNKIKWFHFVQSCLLHTSCDSCWMFHVRTLVCCMHNNIFTFPVRFSHCTVSYLCLVRHFGCSILNNPRWMNALYKY